mgnify:CR=1 FL=1
MKWIRQYKKINLPHQTQLIPKKKISYADDDTDDSSSESEAKYNTNPESDALNYDPTGDTSPIEMIEEVNNELSESMLGNETANGI